MSAKKSEVALERFLFGYDCGQSIVHAFGPDLGLDGETALKGCDLRTPEGRERFLQQDLLHKTCAKRVGTVGEILAGMLDAPTGEAPVARK